MNYTSIRGRPCRIMWCQRDPSLRKTGAGNVFVKNLDASIDNKALCDTFSLFGNILSCKVVVDKEGKSLGYGFVHYETLEAAQEAIRKINGMLISGKPVFVGHFLRRNERADSSKWTNVYVKNVPEAMGDEAFQAMFTAHGTVTSCLLMKTAEGALLPPNPPSLPTLPPPPSLPTPPPPSQPPFSSPSLPHECCTFLPPPSYEHALFAPLSPHEGGGRKVSLSPSRSRASPHALRMQGLSLAPLPLSLAPLRSLSLLSRSLSLSTRQFCNAMHAPSYSCLFLPCCQFFFSFLFLPHPPFSPLPPLPPPAPRPVYQTQA